MRAARGIRSSYSVVLSVIVGLSLLATACGIPHYEANTREGKAAVLDLVNRALSEGDCASAIANIESVYNSAYTDNEVRLARASAYACRAKIDNFFGLMFNVGKSNLGADPDGGSGFFRTTAKLFYTGNSAGTGPDLTALGSQIEASWLAQDALMATLNPGAVVSTLAAVNTATKNPGSAYAPDRTDEANTYMVFVAMATIGALEGYYGSPNTVTWRKGVNKLGATSSNANGWEDPGSVDVNACSYVSSILGFMDSLAVILPKTSGSLKNSLGAITSLESAMNSACDLGCQACGLGAGVCTPCPVALRSRDSCKGSSTDKYSCAAAGVISYIDSNTNPLGWYGP